MTRSVPALPLLAGAYVAGIIGGAILGGPWLLTALVALIIAAAAVLRGAITPIALPLVALAMIATSAGHWRIERLDAEPPPPIAAVTGQHEVVAVARDDAVLTGSLQRIDLDVETVDGVPVVGGIRLSLRATRGLVRTGDRVRLTTDLEPPPSLEAFDYRGYLRDRDIYLVAGFPRVFEHIGAVDRGWRGDLQSLHSRVVARIGRTLPEPAASLAAGVLVGERGRLPDDVDEALRATGTTHLVVVSGQNVALLIGLAVAALTWAMSRRLASVLAVLFLPAYIVFVGADPPVVRAGIMAVAVVAAGVTGRRTPSWVYLVYAVALMLLWDPRLIRDVAFQLSAAATTGITSLAPALRDAIIARFPSLATPGRTALVSIGATATGAALAVLPVQVATFEVIAPWTVLANVAVAPLYEGTVAVAAIAALVGGAGPIGDALAIVPWTFLALVELLAALPHAQIPLEAPLAAGIAFAAGLALVTAHLERIARSQPATAVLDTGVSTHLAGTVGLAVVAGGLWWAVLTPAESLPEVTVLDVGQGLAVLVRDGDSTLLIDTGPADGAILAALGREGVTGEIDAIVLTHDDIDHTGGLADLRQRYDVGAVYAETSTVDWFEGARPIDIGDRITAGRISVDVVGPPTATRDFRLDSDNDGSLVLMVSIGERRVLVTADIEAPAEAWLVASGIDLRADVLIVPHHGSDTSSTPDFLAHVDPAVAVIPVGLNPYGHPHDDVLGRYASITGIRLHRTDEAGAVSFRGDGERFWMSTAR